MSGRKTRSSRHLKNLEEETSSNSSEVKQSETYTLSPSRSTRSALRGKSCPVSSSTSTDKKTDTIVSRGDLQKKPPETVDEKASTKAEKTALVKKTNNELSENKPAQESRSTAASLEFDHYKSKDKSFTSASHVKVVRSLCGETETGRKIYSVSVSEASPKTSPKTSPADDKKPGSNKTTTETVSTVSTLEAADTVDIAEVNDAESSEKIVCSKTTESLELIEFEDGIVFEIGEEEFDDNNASQESFDSSYSSQDVTISQKSSQEAEAETHLPTSQESGVSVTASQESGVSITASQESRVSHTPTDLYSDAEDYLDGKIHQLSSLDFSKVIDVPSEPVDVASEDSKSPVSYPSDQSQFFGMFGLVKKSEVPKDDPNKSKLHRDVGGKLRRTVKPNIRSEMVYTRLTKSSLFDDGSFDDEDDAIVSTSSRDYNSPKILSRTVVLQQEQAKLERSLKIADRYRSQIGKVPVVSIEHKNLNYPALAPRQRFLLTDKSAKNKDKRKTHEVLKEAPAVKKPRLQQSDADLSRNAKSNLHKSPIKAYSNITKIIESPKRSHIKQNTVTGLVSDGHSSGKASPVKASIISRGDIFYLDDVQVKEEPLDEEYENAMQCEVDDQETSQSSRRSGRNPKRKEWKHLLNCEVDDQETSQSSRRSGRNPKRKEWKHLLKANPDIYETVTHLEKQQLFLPQHYYKKTKLTKQPGKATNVEDKIQHLSPKPATLVSRSPVKEKQHVSPRKKKDRNKRRRDCERETRKKFDKVDSSESYLDLYEEVVENQGGANALRLRRRKDWALAKMMLAKAEAIKMARESEPEKWADVPGLQELVEVSMSADEEHQIAQDGTYTRKPHSPLKGRPTYREVKITGSQGESEEPDTMENTKDLLEAIKPMLQDVKTEPKDSDSCNWMNDIKVIKSVSVKEEHIENNDKFAAGKPEPDNFMDILKMREQKRMQRLDESVYSPFNKHVPVVSNKAALEPSKAACQIPHMCNVCWVNDHMYCSNMKRTSRDLPPYGGCLHYIPCEHYSRSKMTKALDEKKQRLVTRGIVKDVPVIKVQKVDETQDDVDILGVDDSSQEEEGVNLDLNCEEEMHTSDTEYTPPQGTELLQTHLQVRGEQIKQSLGLAEHEPVPKENGQVLCYQGNKDSSANSGSAKVLWSAHGAEIIVASENTWYYPPKHLNVLYGNEKDPMLDCWGKKFYLTKKVLTVGNVGDKESKSKPAARVHIKVVPTSVDAEDDSTAKERSAKTAEKSVVKGQNLDGNKHLCTEVVTIHRSCPDRVSVQHSLGEGNDRVLTSEEEINLEDYGRNIRDDGNRKADKAYIMGDIIAKEALKLVCSGHCPAVLSQRFYVKINHDGATLVVKNEKVTDYKKKRKIICKKDYVQVNVNEAGYRKNSGPQVTWDIQNVECERKHLAEIERVVKTVTKNINNFYGRPEIKEGHQSVEQEQQRQERDKKIGNFSSKSRHSRVVTKVVEEDPMEAANRILEEIKWLKQQRLEQVRAGEEVEKEESDEEVNREDITKHDSVVAALVSAARSLADSQKDSCVYPNVSPKDDTKKASKSIEEDTAKPEQSSSEQSRKSCVERDKYGTDNTKEPVSEEDHTARNGSEKTETSESQTLTFSTKDIREKRPHLIEYIKKASLAPVICKKLAAEKSSLENVLTKVDSLFTKLKAELEQKKCLLAAVRSEKYWLEDRQRAFSEKIMTAVDHSVEVTRHLKSMQRGKNKIQLSVEHCNEMLNVVHTIQRNKKEVDPEKGSPKLKPLCINTDKKGRKCVWVLNDKGEYVKIGSSGNKRRHSQYPVQQPTKSDTSGQANADKSNVGGDDGSSLSDHPEGENSAQRIGQSNDESDRSSIDSIDMNVSTRMKPEEKSRLQITGGRIPTVKQLLASKRSRSAKKRNKSPTSSLASVETPPVTPSSTPPPGSNESMTNRDEDSQKSAVGRSVLIKPVAKVTETRRNSGEAQEAKTIYIPAKSAKPKSSVIVEKKLGKANIKSHMPVVIPQEQNAELLSSLINNVGSEATSKVLEKIKDSANSQTSCSSASSRDVDESRQVEGNTKASYSGSANTKPVIIQTSEMSMKSGTIKIPPVSIISEHKPPEAGQSNVNAPNLRPRMVKLTPKMIDKLIESGAAKLTKIDPVGSESSSGFVSVKASMDQSNKLASRTVSSEKKTTSTPSNVTFLVLPTDESGGKKYMESKTADARTNKLSTAIEVTSIPDSVCRKVSESYSNGTKITVQSTPVAGRQSGPKPAQSGSRTRSGKTPENPSIAKQRVGVEGCVGNEQVPWADLPLEQLQTVLRDSELSQSDVRNLMKN